MRRRDQWGGGEREDVDWFVVTEEDVRVVECAMEVGEAVFGKKVVGEKDVGRREVYKTLREFWKRNCEWLLKLCRVRREFYLEWKSEMKELLNNEYEQFCMTEVEKEEFMKAKVHYFKSNLLLRYLDPKTLFELLSVSNDNIGQLSLRENPILTEETKEDICFSLCEEIRSCIFECYYLIECFYNKKEPIQSPGLSKAIIFIINAEKNQDKPSYDCKAKVKESDVNESILTSNIQKENNDLSDNISFYHHDNACEVIQALKNVNSAEKNEILKLYYKCLKIKSSLISNDNLKDIKIHQLKENRVFQKQTSDAPITDANIKATLCQHYEKCVEKVFYYLPEIGIRLCFMHRFHKTYFFCSKYTPLSCFDIRLVLEYCYYYQSESLYSNNRDSFKTLNLKLDEPIIKPNLFESPSRAEWLVVVQNEILMNCTEQCESLNKISDFKDMKQILTGPELIYLDSDIGKNWNYWIPTLDYYENNEKFIQNMLKIDILEYIMENRFPKYFRDKQVDSKAEEIGDYLTKHYVHKELKSNFRTTKSNMETIFSIKNENDCFSTNTPNRKMKLHYQNKSPKASTNKHLNSYEESFQSSSNLHDSESERNENFQKEDIIIKNLNPEQDLTQENKSDCQQDQNNYYGVQDEPFDNNPNVKIEEPSNSESTSEITTSSNNSYSFVDHKSIHPASIYSKSKILSEFTQKEESKTPNLQHSQTNSPKIPEEVHCIEEYTEREIKDLIDEAEQAVYTQRKSHACKFNHKSLSEYYIKKRLAKLEQGELDDPVYSGFELSDFEDFREFALDPRWKDQISISSQGEITVQLDAEKNISFFSLIKSSPEKFENFDLEVYEEQCEVVRNFLDTYFPEKCQFFKLYSKIDKRLCIDYYFNSIVNLSGRVIQEFEICYCELSQHQMMTIFKEFKHVSSLEFWECTLALESVPEFGTSLEGSDIIRLGLSWNNYGDNGFGIGHLIEGLSQSTGFLQNLNKIHFKGCEITGETKEITEQLKKYVDIKKLKISS
ncbi:unnamed protein product [Moneuplotes crassus]|uniref:Uncharacterized protein n=1 Tax=Euplotes crassus TaxID=5936 RepID=A0AAD2CXM1_EUPCR|nr:unnamed protein product [Moneuplotes crassus]